jgi:AraC family transcriptional activator of tynA and feaB
MEKLFSTEDVHRRERFSYWHEVACENLVPHESTPDNGLHFDAEMCAGKIGALDIILFENSAMKVTRTRSQCSTRDNDDLFFCQQLQGQLEIQQAGRETLLTKGDMVLIDPMLPYSGNFRSGSKLLVLKLRRQELRARLGETNGFVGLSSAGKNNEHSLTADFMATLPRWAGKICSSTSELMQTYCVDLIATSIGKLAGGSGRLISSTRASALMAVRMAIEARLQDPSLTPSTIAAAAGITVRYANLLLAPQGTSLSRLMLSRRLDRCRKTLGDSSQAHRTISDIAYGWGFSDMTHFSRTFKAAFGMLPSAYRRMAAASPTAEL